MDKVKAKSKSIDNRSDKEKNSFLDKVLFGKYSVSELLPTVEELLQDSNVQKEIEEVKKVFEKYQEKNRNK